MGFSRQEYYSGLPCHPPGDLPDPGIEPGSLPAETSLCQEATDSGDSGGLSVGGVRCTPCGAPVLVTRDGASAHQVTKLEPASQS